MQLDHVLIAVSDLAVAARELEAGLGLTSIEGGRHPDWGTANRIVPLGETYVELIAVVDPATAAKADLGRWVAANATDSGRPLGWAARPDDLDATAGRLGLAVTSGARVTPSGEVLRWRSAGLDRAIVQPSLPFFIEWAPGMTHPGAAPTAHPAGPAAVTEIHLRGDADQLASWLGTEDHGLPIVLRPGPSTVTGIVLRTGSGEIRVGDGPA